MNGRWENAKGTEIFRNNGEGELCIELQIRRHLYFSHVVQMHLFFILIWEPIPWVSMIPLKGPWDQFPKALLWQQFSRVSRNAYLKWQAAGSWVFLYYFLKSYSCGSDQANLRLKSVPIYLLRTNHVLSPGPSSFTYIPHLFLKTTHKLTSVKITVLIAFETWSQSEDTQKQFRIPFLPLLHSEI